MRTYLFVAIGIAGLAMNSVIGYASVSENVLGLLVVTSLVLIGMGFVPAARKWSHARIATIVMSVAVAVYAICTVANILPALQMD